MQVYLERTSCLAATAGKFLANLYIPVLYSSEHETQFPPLEEERADALEVAAQAHQEGKTSKEDGCCIGVYREVLLDRINFTG